MRIVRVAVVINDVCWGFGFGNLVRLGGHEELDGCYQYHMISGSSFA